jgi:hypothetical protein
MPRELVACVCAIVAYLRNEEGDYKNNPHSDHIWKAIEPVKDWLSQEGRWVPPPLSPDPAGPCVVVDTNDDSPHAMYGLFNSRGDAIWYAFTHLPGWNWLVVSYPPKPPRVDAWEK